MKNNWLSIAALVLIHLLTYVELKGQNQDMKQSFEAAKTTGFSGVVLIAQNGKIVFHEATGFRHFETNEPLQKNDIFELASLYPFLRG
jgi:CubicO group peptidase (beta-lactamase class C family)